MLALTRRIGEEVVIGDPKNPIGTVRVAAIDGDKVRLAFDFPEYIKVNRMEVAKKNGYKKNMSNPDDPLFV